MNIARTEQLAKVFEAALHVDLLIIEYGFRVGNLGVDYFATGDDEMLARGLNTNFNARVALTWGWQWRQCDEEELVITRE